VNKEKRTGCFLVPFMNAFVVFWILQNFGFLEFFIRLIKKIIKLPVEDPNRPHHPPPWN
jgi:hypothetical protein